MTLLLVGLTVLQSLAGAASPPDKLQGLLNRSPFGNTATKPDSVISDHQPLEFRGVLEERGSKIFSIYDTATRRSAWFDLNRAMNGMRIEAYDDVQEFITVVHQGKTLVLTLKGSTQRVRTMEMLSPKTVQVQKTNEYHDKPFRLGHVLEETLIRRAMRRPAAKPANPISR